MRKLYNVIVRNEFVVINRHKIIIDNTLIIGRKIAAHNNKKDMDNSLISLWSLTTWVSPLLLFAASCYFLSKSAKTDSVLLFIGSGIGLLITIFFTLMPQFAQSRYMSLAETSQYYAAAGVISFVGGICFVAGFFTLITNSVNAYKQKQINSINDPFFNKRF